MSNITTEMIVQSITFAIAIAAWTVSFVQLRRGRRQANEDIVFQQKLENYKIIIRESYDFLDSTFSILEELPNFKGTKQEWEKEKMPELFRLHYPKTIKMEAFLRESSIIFPESILVEFDNFTLRCKRILVEHYQFDNKHSIENYEKLTEIHYKLINKIRQDLHIVTLNKKLKNRLSE